MKDYKLLIFILYQASVFARDKNEKEATLNLLNQRGINFGFDEQKFDKPE